MRIVQDVEGPVLRWGRPEQEDAFELNGEAAAGVPATEAEEVDMNQDGFPPGWDEERVRRVLAHYESQTEEEAVAEDEATLEEPDQTVMEVPNDLVPVIRELLAKHRR